MLINWVGRTANARATCWQTGTWRGRIEDIYSTYANWRLDWLDVASMIRKPEIVLAYPMVDRDPLPRWTQGASRSLAMRRTRDPRGGNGANQAILDARALSRCAKAAADLPAALAAYEAERHQGRQWRGSAKPQRAARRHLKVVHETSGDRPFGNIDDLISRDELAAITDGYKRVAGFDKATLQAKG